MESINIAGASCLSPREHRLATVLRGLRDCLFAHGYTTEQVRRRLSFTYPDEVDAVRRVLLLEREASKDDLLAVLVQLFWLEAPVAASSVRRAFGPRLFSEACEVGLLVRRGNAVHARLRAEPVQGSLLWADCRFTPQRGSPRGLPPAGTVYPPSSDSLLLAEVLLLPPGGRVLDLCTGSGVLALCAAASAAEVEAVDVLPRAVLLARLNALANGVQHIAVYQGDLYAPAGKRRFTAIVANPPFVSSPYADAPTYHSGGVRGDRVLARIVRGWHRHLEPGGRAFAISHVGLRAGEALADRARQWLKNFPGRALVVELARGSAVELAAAQASFALRQGLDAYARETHLWVRFLRRNRIQEIVAFLLLGEATGTPALEVVSAVPRVLPLPLSKTAAQLVAEWWRVTGTA